MFAGKAQFGFLAAQALLIAGCNSTPPSLKTPAAAHRPAVHSQAAAEKPSTPTLQPRNLAEQSQRDVEAILKARQAQPETPAMPPVRPTIVWHDRSAATQNSAAAEQPTDGQGALNRIAHAPLKIPDKASPETAGAKRESLSQLLVDVSRELYASGAYSDTPLRELTAIAAMSIVDPTRSLDPNGVPDLTESERELLGHMQTFFLDLNKGFEGDGNVEQSIIDASTKLRQALVREPQLALSAAHLCTRVGGFGDYSTFEKNTFLATGEQKVIVYLEIENFSSELNGNSEFVTELAQQLTIYSDRDGIPVWKEDWQSAVDVTKNKRQDFFTVQVITLPKALSVGRYQLKVRIRDEKSGAEAEGSIPLEMVADPRMTTGK